MAKLKAKDEFKFNSKKFKVTRAHTKQQACETCKKQEGVYGKLCVFCYIHIYSDCYPKRII